MTTPYGPSPQTCIEYVIAAQGNTKLAAARLNKETNPNNTPENQITEARLLTIITQDPNSINTLTTQIRLLTIMQATDAFRLTHAAFLASLPELSPSAISRTYLDLLNVMTQISNITTTPLDPYEAVMRSLPPQVSASIQQLLASQNNPTTNENGAAPPTTPNNIHLPVIIQPASPQEPVTGAKRDANADD